MTIIQILLAAAALWGYDILPSGWTLAVEDVAAPESIPDAGAWSVAKHGGWVCEITYQQYWWDQQSDEKRTRVVAHELGHCLGLDHTDDGVTVMGGGEEVTQEMRETAHGYLPVLPKLERRAVIGLIARSGGGIRGIAAKPY